MLKKAIIITTINEYLKTSIIYFQKYSYDIIVIGDLKTPHETYFDNKNIIYIHPSNLTDCAIFKNLLPHNHYCRKNIGYLYAIKHKYDIIFDTDDDNYPTINFDNFDINTYEVKSITSPKYPNIYSLFTELNIWPRGYPLEYINTKTKIITNNTNKLSEVVIFQSVVNGDPDVDSICRLTNKEYNNDVKFYNNKLYIINKNIYVQGNTQASYWINSKYFYLLYVPSTVSFRFSDILKMYIAQKCIWEYNKLLCYISPHVYQNRNMHNLIEDFKSEYEMYIRNETILEKIENNLDTVHISDIKTMLTVIYNNLFEDNIITKNDINILNKWLSYFK